MTRVCCSNEPCGYRGNRKTLPPKDDCHVNHPFILSVAPHNVGEGCEDDRTFQRVTEEMGEDVSPHQSRPRSPGPPASVRPSVHRRGCSSPALCNQDFLICWKRLAVPAAITWWEQRRGRKDDHWSRVTNRISSTFSPQSRLVFGPRTLLKPAHTSGTPTSHHGLKSLSINYGFRSHLHVFDRCCIIYFIITRPQNPDNLLYFLQ